MNESDIDNLIDELAEAKEVISAQRVLLRDAERRAEKCEHYFERMTVAEARIREECNDQKNKLRRR